MESARGVQPDQDLEEKPAEATRPEITERVLAYFRRNSEAMDSVEGIARFWVSGDRSLVERSVVDLHARGLLDRRLIGGTAFYSLPKDRSATPVPEARPIPPGASATSSSLVADPAGSPVSTAPEAPGRLPVIDLEFLLTLASQMTVAIESARLVKEMEDGYLAAIIGVIQAMEDLRPETQGHSRLVARIAVGTARAMDLPDANVSDLARAAALHEVGRLVSRSEAGPEPEGAAAPAWDAAAVMATERVLAPIASLRVVREIILHSAPGFEPPATIGAENPPIPIESRILSICEDFARLAGGNELDPARRRDAIKIIRQRAGGKHDSEVVEALCRVVDGRGIKGGRR